jgi:AcrR family transcriptional regulator
MANRIGPDQAELAGRQLILREAARLFLTTGYGRTSISQIAEATGMVKSAIYHHFPSKEHLYLAVIGELAGRLGARLQECTRGGTWRAQLTNAARCLAQFYAEEQIDLPSVLRDVGLVASVDFITWRNRLAPVVLAPITRAIEQGIAAGEIAAVDPLWASWLLAVMAGASSLPMTRDPQADATGQSIDLFLRGIEAPR